MTTRSAYLAALENALVGPSRLRRDLVREAGDHLDDAVDAYLRAGLVLPDAERRAVADFGRLDEIVPAFQTTLAFAAARRAAWLLFAALAPQPFLWDGPVGLGAASGAKAPDTALHAALDVALEAVGGAAMVVALLLVGATTVGQRWFGREIARTTSLVTLVTTLTTTTMAVGMSVLSGASAPMFWVLFATCLLAPMCLAAWSGRRTLASC